MPPRVYKELRAAVVRNMVHLKDPRGYPKPFCSATRHEHRKKPEYRRREFEPGRDGQVKMEEVTNKKDRLGNWIVITNEHVVPYNPALLMLPGAASWHVNVEIVANAVGNVKYLYYCARPCSSMPHS